MVARVSPRVCFCLAVVIVLSCMPYLATPAPLPVDCVTLPQWTNRSDRLQVHQAHIFCGEWRNATPRGFHSRPAGLNPLTVDQFTITQRANTQGIYGGTWSYRGHPQLRKFSTMFPDACSRQQVLNTVLYAARHRTPCPASAPDWAVCGPNRPDPVPPDAGQFCEANNGTLFMVAMALRRNGNVITAFPLR
jgi:hypothetical protein